MEIITYDEEIFKELPELNGPVEFYSCRFEQANFSHIDIRGLKFIDCTFTSCDASNLNVTNFTFRDCKFHNCKLVGINWCVAKNLSLLEFESTLLDMNTFQGLDISNTKFNNCRLRDVDFSDCIIENGEFVESDLTEANFNGANVKNSDFRKAKNYFIDPHFTQLGKSKFNLPEALTFFKALGIEIEP
ncbi:MAG: pentapeptide repeat-containing protein [Oligoflexia bacterium]|nr:pentapeptide repeat-containing protein [Oligoflexia bacterium]